MSLGPLLLRVMLILAFVLNGTTPTMAHAQMPPGHSMPQHDAVQAAGPANHEGMPGCHREDMAADEVATSAHDHTPHSIPPKQHEHSSDCCGSGSGSCSCVCAHGMNATVPFLALHVYGRTGESVVPATNHAAPALPHLIRPPIG